MLLEPHATLHGFTVQSVEQLPEIDGEAYVLLHEASKAKLLYLKNEDNNKAFSIAFKTPPADNTGTFHILEHSVLCGSAKFPVKEPFVNLLKSSMQTFLNAMTFPDKTMYPVASTNEQDLLNLMDVYLDAVLHPNIYSKRAIFEQEGWHYELMPDSEGKQPKLVYNGVVYNEMKGVLSDPESVLFDALSAALFPDTAYRFESGGTPEAIPDLTYEAFLDNHSRHYRLNNSYLCLYGNLDIETFLAFLDDKYLSPCANLNNNAAAPNDLSFQAPLVNFGQKKFMNTTPDNAGMVMGFVVGEAKDARRMNAASILLDALTGSNEAPLKRALLDADLANDIQAFGADSILQPFMVLELLGLKEGAAERFPQVVQETIAKLADEGLDSQILEASLSRAEFIQRERNIGVADGVALAMASLSGWLYDDSLAIAYLRYEDDYAFFRANLDTGYFENLMREIFLDNNHAASVELIPVATAEEVARKENRLTEQERLESVAANFSEEDFKKTEDEVALLRQAQEMPDNPEDLLRLPQLTLEDLSEAPHEIPPKETVRDGVLCLRHQVPTHGITYAYRYFDVNSCTYEELPYLVILSMLLGKMDTSKHSAAEIDKLRKSKLGNMVFFVEVHDNQWDTNKPQVTLTLSSSALKEKVSSLGSLPKEILLETKFDDTSKILDVLLQKRVSLEQDFCNAGHSAAMQRVSSYYTPWGMLREQLNGVDFYLFIKDLIDNFDQRKEDLVETLRQLQQKVFTDHHSVVSFTGSDEDFEIYWKAGGLLQVQDDKPEATSSATVSESSANTENRNTNKQISLHGHEGFGKYDNTLIASTPIPAPQNEAFIVPSDVSYSALGFDRRNENIDYSGSWLVASRMLSYDYLWNEVRVKGGAYGVGFQVVRTGNMCFYSYRDPRVNETLERFKQSARWLSTCETPERELTGYLISTVAGVDTPLKARDFIRRQDGEYFAGIAPSFRQQIRTEVINTTENDLHVIGYALTNALEHAPACTFGNKAILESAQNKFTLKELLKSE